MSRDSALCYVCHVTCLFLGRLTGTQELDRNSRGIGQSPQEINFINEVSIITITSIFLSFQQYFSHKICPLCSGNVLNNIYLKMFFLE